MIDREKAAYRDDQRDERQHVYDTIEHFEEVKANGPWDIEGEVCQRRRVAGLERRR